MSEPVGGRQFCICNSGTEPLTVLLEPWAEDYTLRSNETLKFVAIAPGADFHFICELGEPGFATLWAEGHDEGVIAQTDDGHEVGCGYQRELSPSEFLRKHLPSKR